jgi:hypothetical protein
MLNRPPHPARPGWRKRRRRSTLSPKGERVLNLDLPFDPALRGDLHLDLPFAGT